MKGVFEKLIGKQVTVRTLDSAECAGVVRQVYDDSFLALLADGSFTLIPFAAISAASFK